MNVLLEVKGLSVAYRKVQALSGMNLSVQAGQVVTVIGPNGAGKSTLLNALIGVLPSSGLLRFEGQDITRLSVEERVELGMCLVPEKRELFTEMSVEDNLYMGAFSRTRRKKDMESDLQAIYSRFPRLLERREQLAATLSGGERQMLALARALMARPRLLMLDEPSLGLAPLMVQEMFRIISDLRQSGVSMLLIEQNARAALRVADHGHVLETGEVVLSDTASALRQNARVLETYLGSAAMRV
jgi:branched-chain amino acid transport system ATP-binding protein